MTYTNLAYKRTSDFSYLGMVNDLPAGLEYYLQSAGIVRRLRAFPNTRAVVNRLLGSGTPGQLSEFWVLWPDDTGDVVDMLVAKIEFRCSAVGQWHLVSIWAQPSALGDCFVGNWDCTLEDMKWFKSRVDRACVKAGRIHIYKELLDEGLGPYERLLLEPGRPIVLPTVGHRQMLLELSRSGFVEGNVQVVE